MPYGFVKKVRDVLYCVGVKVFEVLSVPVDFLFFSFLMASATSFVENGLARW